MCSNASLNACACWIVALYNWCRSSCVLGSHRLRSSVLLFFVAHMCVYVLFAVFQFDLNVRGRGRSVSCSKLPLSHFCPDFLRSCWFLSVLFLSVRSVHPFVGNTRFLLFFCRVFCFCFLVAPPLPVLVCRHFCLFVQGSFCSHCVAPVFPRHLPSVHPTHPGLPHLSAAPHRSEGGDPAVAATFEQMNRERCYMWNKVLEFEAEFGSFVAGGWKCADLRKPLVSAGPAV